LVDSNEKPIYLVLGLGTLANFLDLKILLDYSLFTWSLLVPVGHCWARTFPNNY